MKHTYHMSKQSKSSQAECQIRKKDWYIRVKDEELNTRKTRTYLDFSTSGHLSNFKGDVDHVRVVSWYLRCCVFNGPILVLVAICATDTCWSSAGVEIVSILSRCPNKCWCFDCSRIGNFLATVKCFLVSVAITSNLIRDWFDPRFGCGAKVSAL